MTEEEIDKLRGAELEVAYAEQVLGYSYHPGKAERKPWWNRQGYPAMEYLPHYLGWEYVLRQINLLTSLTQRWPFHGVLKEERFRVRVSFDERYYDVKIHLLTDSDDRSGFVKEWQGGGISLGEAFLRAMLKVAEWFCKERGWAPK